MSFLSSFMAGLEQMDADSNLSFEEQLLRSAHRSGFARLASLGSARSSPTTFPPSCPPFWEVLKQHSAQFQPSTIHHTQLRRLVKPIVNDQGEQLLILVHQTDIVALRLVKDSASRRCIKVPVVTLSFEPICMDANHGYLVGGGRDGQLTVKKLHANGHEIERDVFRDDVCTSAVNSVRVELQQDGSPILLICYNDCTMEMRQLPGMELMYSTVMAAPINFAALGPDKKHILAVGDCYEAFLLAPENSMPILSSFRESTDFGFCGAWHRNETTFAAGGQDGLVNVWDTRYRSGDTSSKNTGHTIAQFRSAQKNESGAIRSMHFSRCQEMPVDLLLFTEHANRFSVVDTRAFYERQEVDMSCLALPHGFNYNIDIGGAAFSNDGKHVFVAAKSKLHQWEVDLDCRRFHAAFDFR